MTKSLQSIGVPFAIGAAALVFAWVGGPNGARAGGGADWFEIDGVFLGDGLVTAASSGCTSAVGDTFNNVFEVQKGNFESAKPWHQDQLGFVVRESLNNSSNFGIIIAVFPSIPQPNTATSGTFQYGLEGQTLTSGTYQITIQPLSQDSFLMTDTLTYTPIGGTGTCTESDQVTYIRAS